MPSKKLIKGTFFLKKFADIFQNLKKKKKKRNIIGFSTSNSIAVVNFFNFSELVKVSEALRAFRDNYATRLSAENDEIKMKITNLERIIENQMNSLAAANLRFFLTVSFTSFFPSLHRFFVEFLKVGESIKELEIWDSNIFICKISSSFEFLKFILHTETC